MEDSGLTIGVLGLVGMFKDYIDFFAMISVANAQEGCDPLSSAFPISRLQCILSYGVFGSIGVLVEVCKVCRGTNPHNKSTRVVLPKA